MMDSRKNALLLSGVCFCGLISTPGHAQSASQSASSQAPAPGDIIVTAQRRSERLIDVPMSVTALSSDKLVKSGIINTADLAKVTPGLVMTYFGISLQPSIRGVTATGGNTGDNPSVSTYIDGVYQSEQVASLVDLPDVAQIEVLKGPQGTLYGQNSTGGAIVITTLSPSFTTTGKASVSYGNFGDIQLRGFVSAPLVSDKIAFSLAGSLQNREGFRTNLITGTHNKDLNSKVVRGKILIQPWETAKITLTGYYSDRADSGPYATVPLNNDSLGYAIFPDAPKVTDPSKQYAGLPDVFIRSKGYGGSAKGQFDFDPGTLNLIVAYSKEKISAMEDLDGSPINLANYIYGSLYGETQLNEVNFVSRQLGKFHFLVGGMYLNTKSYFDRGIYVQYPATTVQPELPPPPVTDFPSYGRVNKHVLAGYGQVTFDVTDKLSVTGGMRYTHESQTAVSDLGYLPAPIPSPFNPKKWSKISPQATVKYAFTPGSNVYATFATGFKGGLINTSDLSQQPVKPETIKSYEVGYKGRLASNFTLTIAGYYYNYKNLQVAAYKGGTTGTYESQNAASSTGRGFEANADWALTREFSVSGGLAFTKAKYKHFPDALVWVPSGFGGNVAVTEDLSGKPLLRAPKWSGNFSANYSKDVGVGTIGAYASVYVTSGQFIDSYNQIWQKGYETLDAELSYSPAAAPGLRLVLWGKNLTNKAYLNTSLVTAFADSVAYADPRTYGVRAEIKF